VIRLASALYIVTTQYCARAGDVTCSTVRVRVGVTRIDKSPQGNHHTLIVGGSELADGRMQWH
jgi:hypothetical protein